MYTKPLSQKERLHSKRYYLSFFLDGDRSFWPFLLDGTFPFGRSFWTVPLLMGKHIPISVKLSNWCRLQLVATEASN